MAKLLDKSARRGGCRWLPCRLTSGLDSADPDETTVRSVVTLVISKMESGPASVDVASSCPLWPPVRDQAAGESLGSGKHKYHGGDGDIKPGLQPSCPPDEA